MEEVYAALDVSDKTTHVCVVDGAGGNSGDTIPNSLELL